MWNKWGFFLVCDEKRSNFAFTKQGQSVVPKKSKNSFFISIV
jgi:hypothetical protein